MNSKIQYIRIYDIHMLPNKIGAYVITHTYDNINAEKYVGSTENFCNRVNSHYKKRVIYIDLFVTNDIHLAKSLEKVLIKLIRPFTNIKTPSLSDEDKELMKELLENTEIQKYILEKHVKTGYRYLNYNIGENIKEKGKGTTVYLGNESYKLIMNKRFEIFKSNGKNIPIQDLVSQYIKKGMIDLIKPNIFFETVVGAYKVDETHIICPSCNEEISVVSHNININIIGDCNIKCQRCNSKYNLRLIKIN